MVLQPSISLARIQAEAPAEQVVSARLLPTAVAPADDADGAVEVPEEVPSTA